MLLSPKKSRGPLTNMSRHCDRLVGTFTNIKGCAQKARVLNLEKTATHCGLCLQFCTVSPDNKKIGRVVQVWHKDPGATEYDGECARLKRYNLVTAFVLQVALL